MKGAKDMIAKHLLHFQNNDRVLRPGSAKITFLLLQLMVIGEQTGQFSGPYEQHLFSASNIRKTPAYGTQI